MSHSLEFSINRISAPRLSFPDFLAMCGRLGVSNIEIRNDLKNVEIDDGSDARQLRAATAAAGIAIRSINALYPFDICDAGLEQRAVQLAAYAQECGAEALVMCPLNSRDDHRSAGTRYTDLVHALKTLRPILDDHGIIGLVEPLGFEESALRHKPEAIKAIFEASGERHYRLVHDTFHHFLSGDETFFPELTGLVHISGVEAPDLSPEQMRDGHRVFVGAADRLGNIAQLRTLLACGYTGPVSFEPFAEQIMRMDNTEALLSGSMAYIGANLA
ncbi:iolI protein [Acidocella aquatica]|uniref:IolI protein n=1 Tax=Acidocella aquatica TaxID=1922313 RepID=A0ABQ6A711_9PROT|nr:TIM barrel protein [Acidocella aquatica]GLR65988.1 iolI protein [Acidocella aquatica]